MSSAPKVTFLVTGIGCSCLDYSLATLFANPLPDEVIFVQDDVGRSLAQTHLLSQLHLEEFYPQLRVIHNTNFTDWGQCNQTVNLGMHHATGDFVMVAHEDMIWPHFDYAGKLRSVFSWLRGRDHVVQGKKIAGVVVTAYEQQREREEPGWLHPIGLTQYFLAHTTCFSKAFWQEIGGSDEHNGVWWDAYVQTKLWELDRWLLFLRWPGIVHLGSKSNAAHNWANEWKNAPAWGNFNASYQKIHGRPFVRPRDSFVAFEDNPELRAFLLGT